MKTVVESTQVGPDLSWPVRLPRAVRADFANIRATATARALLVGSVVMAGASCIANLATVSPGDLGSSDTVQLAMHASTVATLVFAMVAGAVSATADFRFGRVDQLLLSESRRAVFVVAKTLVALLVGVVYGVVGSVAAVAATGGFLAVNGASFDVLSGVVVQPLVGLLVGAGLLGACGAGIGVAVRNQPAALAGSLAWMLIVEPTALLGLPAGGRWLPGAAGLALTRSPDPDLLGQVSGGLLLVAWAVVAGTIALVSFRGADL